VPSLADLAPFTQRMAAGVARLVPRPPGLARLGERRARLAERIVARRADEIARIRRRYEDAVARCRDGALGSDAPEAAHLARLAGALIDELRAETAEGAGGEAWLDLTARLDAMLPATTTEYVDRAEFSEVKRTRMIGWMDGYNRAFGSYVRFLDALAPLLDGLPGEAVTLLDLGSGHGGFPIALEALVRDGVASDPKPLAGRPDLRIIASDVRPEYVEMAREKARLAGASRLEARVLDAFRLGASLRPGEVDVITCTQSLHHFGSGGACLILAEAVRHARRGVLFVDLTRALSLVVALSSVALFTTFDAAFFHDAFVSARKAFVPEELRLLAAVVPGGESLEAFHLPPGFAALRTRRA
jgi:SAM-dependent methyltransferase